MVVVQVGEIGFSACGERAKGQLEHFSNLSEQAWVIQFLPLRAPIVNVANFLGLLITSQTAQASQALLSDVSATQL